MKDSAHSQPGTQPSNRWLILGIVATIALAALVTVSLTGVLHRGSTKRDAVGVYILEVNAAQRSVAAQRQQVGNTYAKVRTDPRGLAGSLPALERSVVTLRRFDAKLRALRPPPEAAALHRRLIALSAAEAGFARQIVLLARYLPALTAERRSVGKAGSTLRLDLSSSKGTTAQAAAFDRFAERLTAARHPLIRVQAPAAIAPARDQELAQTAALATTASGLADAIRSRRNADARQLLYKLSLVAVGNGNAVERASVIAFDAQARRINALRVAVAAERSRLDKELQ